MSRSRSPALALALFAIPLTLAACGDDGGGDGEDQITEAIETAATGTDPEEKCTVVVTQAFVEQTEFSTGEAAVSACEENATEAVADSVEVSSIEVEGDSATAEAAFTGGGLDGQTLAISLVNEGDQWKLDQLEEFVDFDPQAFAAALVENIGESGQVPQQIVDCVGDQIESADPEQVQSAFLSGDQGQFIGLFAACLRD